MKSKKYILIGVSVLAALVILGIVTAAHFSSQKNSPHSGAVDGESLIYYCPMHPDFTSDKPGRCPICGMDLVSGAVEKEKTESSSDEASVTITPERQQLIGLKWVTIGTKDVQKTIRTVGEVAYDPDLAIAQREYIEAGKLGDEKLKEAAKQRLTLMGLDPEHINKLARTGNVDENLYLMKKTAWVYPVIYENELPHVSLGQNVKFELTGGGGEREGVIRGIDPIVKEETRTIRLRIEVPNEDKALRPGMFVNATITQDIGKKLTVPKDSVIDSGERRIVFVVHDGEHFMPQEIRTGAELEDSYVVEEGLKDGDMVVSSASFLLDAESKLKAAIGGGSGHKH